MPNALPPSRDLARTRERLTADAATVARTLIGARLESQINDQLTAGIIVETEAYLGPEDAAAHCFGDRRTARTETMYGAPGKAYVYLNYGIHHLLNVVTGPVDHPAAVLIRALAPTDGLPLMRERRPAARRDTDLCSGPGKLSAALGIRVDAHNAIDLLADPELRLTFPQAFAASIDASPRIGVDYAAQHPGGWDQRPLRFTLRGDANLSRPVPAPPPRP